MPPARDGRGDGAEPLRAEGAHAVKLPPTRTKRGPLQPGRAKGVIAGLLLLLVPGTDIRGLRRELCPRLCLPVLHCEARDAGEFVRVVRDQS
jgi:hypothetical protein